VISADERKVEDLYREKLLLKEKICLLQDCYARL